MNFPIRTALAAFIMLASAQAFAQITLYPREGWRGRPVNITRSIRDLGAAGFDIAEVEQQGRRQASVAQRPALKRPQPNQRSSQGNSGQSSQPAQSRASGLPFISHWPADPSDSGSEPKRSTLECPQPEQRRE